MTINSRPTANLVICTNGSVDQLFGHAATTFHCSNYSKGWKISNQCSSLQVELSAINQALEYAINADSPFLLIYTDSYSAI